MPDVEKKKSGFSLKNLFVAEVPETASAQAQPVQAPVSRAAVGTPSTPAVDTKARETLLLSIEANKLDSYDYLKFKSTVTELASDIPDEKLRFKSAFTGAKAMGVTKDKLIQTAQHYITVLNEELKSFNDAVSDQVKARITAGEDRIKSLEATIASKQEQIKQLTGEIETLNQERNTLSGKVSDDKFQIDSRKRSFEATHGEMVKDIQNDINKLTTFLG